MNRTGEISSHSPSWYRIVYKYDLINESLHDTPTVFFHADFIRDPSFSWTVDWSDGAQCLHIRNHMPCHETHMAGVLLKHAETGRVWRLTGNTDPDADGLVYEGRWPD